MGFAPQPRRKGVDIIHGYGGIRSPSLDAQSVSSADVDISSPAIGGVLPLQHAGHRLEAGLRSPGIRSPSPGIRPFSPLVRMPAAAPPPFIHPMIPTFPPTPAARSPSPLFQASWPHHLHHHHAAMMTPPTTAPLMQQHPAAIRAASVGPIIPHPPGPLQMVDSFEGKTSRSTNQH